MGQAVLFAVSLVVYQVTFAATTPQVFTDEWFFGADSYRAAITEFRQQNPLAGWQIKKHPLYVAMCVPLHRAAALAYGGLPEPYRQNFALAFPVALMGAANLCVAYALLRQIGFGAMAAFAPTALYGAAAAIWFFAAYPDTYICTALLTNVFLWIHLRDRRRTASAVTARDRWFVLAVVNVLACFATPQQVLLAVIPLVTYWRRGPRPEAMRRSAKYLAVLTAGYVIPFIALTAMDWHGHIDVHRLGFVRSELRNWSSITHLWSAADWFSVLTSFLVVANIAPHIDLAGFAPMTREALAAAPIAFWVLTAAMGVYCVTGLARSAGRAQREAGLELVLFCGAYLAFFVYFNPREAFIYSGPMLLPVWLLVQQGYASARPGRTWGIVTVLLCAATLINNGSLAWDLQFHQSDLPRLKTVRPPAA